ncbi:Fic family protein [Leptospira fletcheri]|nr:Fic family protein [Leptospira fletcheri]
MVSKNIGIRKTQNRIINQVTGEIIYTPPEAREIPDLISNLEKFIHDESIRLDPLVCAGLVHYQFEAIHPFPDGNGRTGRILIVLQLIQLGILNLPKLYIRGCINRHRETYYKFLNKISFQVGWVPSIQFMLEAFLSQALETIKVLFDILSLFLELKEIFKDRFPNIARSNMLETIFSHPVIAPVKLGELLNVHYTTATKYLTELREARILHDLISGKYHFYLNHRLLGVLSK